MPIYASSALLFIGSSDVYMFFATGSDLLASSAPGGTGTFRLYGLKDNSPDPASTTKFAVDLGDGDEFGRPCHRRAAVDVAVGGGRHRVLHDDDRDRDHAVRRLQREPVRADVRGRRGVRLERQRQNRSRTKARSSKTLAGRATAPFIVDQHLYLGTAGAAGAKVEAFGDPDDFNNGIGQVGVRILSWREIR